MSDLSAILALPYLMPAQAQKHVTHNEALRILDVVVQLAVQDRDLAAPPALPAEGERYLVAAGASGAWAGQAGRIAAFLDGGWSFLAPRPGWRAEVLDEGLAVVWDGSGWIAADRVARLGINTDADATNRLAVSAPATLFTHAGDDHRLKLNKAAAGATASLLFQSAWSGRAEIGLAGSDDLALKVSADGSAWTAALAVAAATGVVDAAAGLTVAGQAAYHRGNLVGTVAQAGGLPAGAAIERGANADGDYAKFADGTLLCHHVLAGSAAAATTWTFPAAFAAPPAVLGTAEAAVLSVLCLDAAPTATAASFSLRDRTDARRADTVRLVATGRWF